MIKKNSLLFQVVTTIIKKVSNIKKRKEKKLYCKLQEK